MVGVDQRFEVMAAPGLVGSMQHGQRVANDPAVLKLMLGLGANKGLHGVGLFMATPSSVISRTPIRHLADFKGKKIRIFASKFQSVAFERLGVTPVAMTLGDVLPAIQQGAIDGADAALNVYVPFHYVDAAKYVTADQPAGHLHHHGDQPEMVRFPAQGFAADRRQGCGGRIGEDQSVGARFPP